MHSPYQVTPQTQLHSGLGSGWVFQKMLKSFFCLGHCCDWLFLCTVFVCFFVFKHH